MHKLKKEKLLPVLNIFFCCIIFRLPTFCIIWFYHMLASYACRARYSFRPSVRMSAQMTDSIVSKRIDVKCMGLEKITIVDQNCRLSRKRYEVGRWLQWTITRKSQIPDRSFSVPVTLSDLERRKTGLRPKESVLVLVL